MGPAERGNTKAEKPGHSDEFESHVQNPVPSCKGLISRPRRCAGSTGRILGLAERRVFPQPAVFLTRLAAFDPREATTLLKCSQPLLPPADSPRRCGARNQPVERHPVLRCFLGIPTACNQDCVYFFGWGPMILSGSIRTPDDVTIGPARSRPHKLIIMEPNGVPLTRLAAIKLRAKWHLRPGSRRGRSQVLRAVTAVELTN
jgi:hypothetical protein